MTILIKLRILCFILFFMLLSPFSVIARENLFTISTSSQLQIYNPQFAFETAEFSGKETITLNDRLLSSLAGDELDFVTVSGTAYVVIFDRLSKGSNSNTWIGHLKGYGIQYRVIITLNTNGVEGRISTPDGVMHIKSSKDGVILLDYELEGMQKVPFGDDVLLSEDEAFLSQTDHSLLYDENNTSLAAAPSSINGNTLVDVLVLYNEDFKSFNNNDASTRIDHLVALTNQAYLDSQVAMQIRVVAAELIDYSTIPSNNDALDAISGSSILANDVAALRNQTGADLVIFIRPYKASTHGGCGLAMLNKYMSTSQVYSTVSDGIDIDYSGSGYYSFCPDDSFAHELGHTMGLAHDIANSSSSGSHPYSYGYGSAGLFGTIMSYFSPGVSLFSNPNISACNGYTCGLETADNARSLTDDKDIISGFKDEVISHTVNLNGVYMLLLH